MFLSIFSGTAAQRELWPRHTRLLDHTQSVGLLCTSGQLVAENST
jgi:hypothetical protein